MAINPITLHHKYTGLASRNKGNMQSIGDMYFFPLIIRINHKANPESETIVNFL